MASADFNIDYTAKLARIALTEAEQQEYGSQLAEVLQYVEKLNELNVADVMPTTHPTPLTNVTRPDVVTPSISTEAALMNAPAQVNQLFRVSKIVE
ncbi:MAG: Glutamyl-tRNA(Gln) amidotransferase subunit C [Verrucomicrobia subdivision 3 bacterium]|nr:Glutamyl-tRNA(Gln) amidotransferase subunit C [Limisphaerales bacterium]MCS1413857.1 Glutamyl-tRNA(Gln) amidotransferase subunit C [Limisphaerales bacterium]